VIHAGPGVDPYNCIVRAKLLGLLLRLKVMSRNDIRFAASRGNEQTKAIRASSSRDIVWLLFHGLTGYLRGIPSVMKHRAQNDRRLVPLFRGCPLCTPDFLVSIKDDRFLDDTDAEEAVYLAKNSLGPSRLSQFYSARAISPPRV